MKNFLGVIFCLFFFIGLSPVVFADTLTLPLNLPATIKGDTYTNAIAILKSDNSGSLYYYKQNSISDFSGYSGCPASLPIKPTVYTPYNRHDLWYSKMEKCTFTIAQTISYCTDSTHWTTFNGASNMGLGTYTIIGGTGGQAYSNLDWVNTNSGLCQQGTVYKTANWEDYIPSVPANDTIDDPLEGDYKPVGNYTFSGQCKNKGLHYSMNWRDFNFASTPNITCQDDYTWSADYEIVESGGGGRAYYLYNHETEEYIYVAVIGYVSDTLDWFVGLDYPQLNDKGYAKVEADANFPLRFKYRVPEVDRNEVSLIFQSCDSDYLNCSHIYNNSLQFFDENKTGYFEDEIDWSTAGTLYYTLDLVDDTLSTVEFSQKIKIEITETPDSETQSPILPDKKDLGYFGNQIRDLFVPSYGYMPAMTSMLKDDFSEKFLSIITVKDSFISSFSNIGTTSLDNLPHITIYGANVAPFDLQFIDPYITQFKLYMSAGMYLLCAIFLIRKTATIFKS